MADYTPITDSQVDPDAPLTSELAYAWRDNPIAITEGALGAPRIVDAALSTTATSTGRNWVVNRYLLVGFGDVGGFAMLNETTSTARSPGFTTAASNLRWASAGAVSGTPPSGTWMLCGIAQGTSAERSSVWKRIA